jgi:hypothetical protein
LTRHHPLIVCAIVALSFLSFASELRAEPFTIQALLTGDVRLENPDNIVVRVSVAGDTTSNVTAWSVDLDSPTLHPDMSLGGFFFNLNVDDPSVISFADFSPSGWNINYNSRLKNAQGSGGAAFEFVSKDPAGTSNNVTNTVDLTFTATLGEGQFWTTAMLLGAPLSDGDAIANPGAQLGAHVRSLSTTDCPTCDTDSGFAAGNYTIPDVEPVPEPSSLILLGSGATAAFVRFRRRWQG